ncbi:asparaginase [Angelakisella massiliensis]|uniref:asparaginase n=1 Tax=Angelakisella massiliensis TaxID=1871018 RepID=UPI0023A90495|nr:asparaginase [Angelakisella massiliensis]
MKKRVCIIYTGGTIGMVPSEQGYVPRKDYLASQMARMPEFSSPDMPEYDLVEFDPLLDSSNMSVREWNQIGAAIRERYFDYDGFVVLHGTDTMAYTASALSFMLEGLEKPVVLTGSQIPFCELRSDARDNLTTAVMIAAQGQVPEVCLYFSGRLLRGNRATKLSADELIAFDSPNYPALAKAGVRITLSPQNIRPRGTELRVHLFQPVQIAVLKVFPGIRFEVFENLVTSGVKGIVLEAFGAGNIPSEGNGLLELLDKAKQNGTIVVVCTQCLRGSAHIGAYEASAELKKGGAVCGYDMTVEAAVAKLYYLFSQEYEEAQIKAAMEKDLRGELSVPELI